MSIAVTKEVKYSIGHRLHRYVGLCANLHGHNYTIQATVEGNPDLLGLVIDFKDLKGILHSILEPFDHAMVLHVDDPLAQNLPGRLVLLSVNPTAENLASLIFNRLRDEGVSQVIRVVVRETDTGWAEATKVDRSVRIMGVSK